MDVLWLGIGIFAVIFIGFFIIIGVGRLFSGKSKKDTPRSSWLPIQVYSGDDALDHPDLKRITDLQE